MAGRYCAKARPSRAHTSAALDLMKLLNSHGASASRPGGVAARLQVRSSDPALPAQRPRLQHQRRRIAASYILQSGLARQDTGPTTTHRRASRRAPGSRPVAPEPVQASRAQVRADNPAPVTDGLKTIERSREVTRSFIEVPGQAPGVAAVAGHHRRSAPVLQLRKDRHALAEHRDRGLGVPVVAVHDGELLDGPGFPPAITKLPDHGGAVAAFGEQAFAEHFPGQHLSRPGLEALAAASGRLAH